MMETLTKTARGSAWTDLRAWRALVFPGDRRVWLWSLVALVPMLALIVIALVQPRVVYTSTNSVGARSIVQTVSKGQTLCVPGVPLAGGTGEVQLGYGVSGAAPTVKVRAVLHGRTLASGSYTGIPGNPPARATIPISPTLPSNLGDPLGSICMKVVNGGSMLLAGFATLPTNGPAPKLDGKPTESSIAVWLLPPKGAERSLIDSWASAMRHLTIFRPGFAGVDFYWVLFLLVLPLLSYAGLRLLAVSREPGRRLVLGLVLISFIGSASWAITTAAFDGPDESEHFAYTQYLAETGKAPAPNAPPPGWPVHRSGQATRSSRSTRPTTSLRSSLTTRGRRGRRPRKSSGGCVWIGRNLPVTMAAATRPRPPPTRRCTTRP